MGTSASKKSETVVAEGQNSRPLSKAFLPRIQSPKVLINILDCLYPHEIVALQYSNTYIYEFLNDDMIWMRLLAKNARMHLFTPGHLLFFYPDSDHPIIRMPLKPTIPLPLQYTSVETLEHRLFLIGGYFETEGRNVPTGEVSEYLERKARLATKERMTEERYNCHIAVRQNEVFVMGGENGKEQILSCEKYIIADNIWISLSFLMAPIHRGVVYAVDDFVYHLEPESGCITLYTYTCNDNLWDVKSLLLPSDLAMNKLNFCETVGEEGAVLVFGDQNVFELSLASGKVTYEAKKNDYGAQLELGKCSHVATDRAAYGINQKHLIKYETGGAVGVVLNYTFEAVAGALKRKAAK